jgi:protein-disulfide isomerase
MAKNATTTPKNAAAAEARAKAQAQMRTQERRTMVIIVAVVVSVVVLFGAVVMFIMNQSSGTDLIEGGDGVPASSTASGGFPVGQTGVVGDAVLEDAPTVAVYLDFLCGACAQFEALVGPELDAMREEGLITVEYHPVAILDRGSPTQYSTRAASAAATVADGSPEHFHAFAYLLFQNQPGQGMNHWTDAELADLAREAGVPDEVAATIPDGQFRQWVTSATQRASVDGMQGTPTVSVNGEILDQRDVPYFDEGVLRDYIANLDAA